MKNKGFPRVSKEYLHSNFDEPNDNDGMNILTLIFSVAAIILSLYNLLKDI
jgi:hypothetical protein